MACRWLACVALVAVAGCGGGEPKRAEQAARESAPRLTPAVARELDAGFSAQVKDAGVPGATAAVVFPDGREWTSAQGFAVLEPPRRMTARTSFPLDSVTKLATAALAMRLVELGRLSLEDPILRWYPGWRGDPAATVRDLLRHTAGTREPSDAFLVRMSADPRRATTAGQVLAAAPKPGPRTKEGQYSNTGFVLLGQILVRAGGAPAAALMRREIFDHPGGEGLVLQPAERPHRPHVHNYTYPQGAGHPIDVTRDGAYIPFRAFTGLASTAGALAGDDLSLARWAHQLLGGRLLRPESLREMTRFHAIAYWNGYGLGLEASEQDGHPMWGHQGDGLGSHTELWHLPREDLTIAVSWNDDLIDSDSPILRTLVRAALR
jgi:D-alanyl-D-alanine carboxypeptidase